MGEPNDLRARAASIFERLRSSNDGAPRPSPPAPSEGAEAEHSGPPDDAPESGTGPPATGVPPTSAFGEGPEREPHRGPGDPIGPPSPPSEPPGLTGQPRASSSPSGPPAPPSTGDAGSATARWPGDEVAGSPTDSSSTGSPPIAATPPTATPPAVTPATAATAPAAASTIAHDITAGLGASLDATIGGATASGPEPTSATGHPAAREHPLPRRFAIANQKGGVGKTTTAVNLGAALAELQYRVLVIDLDPQGNATTGLGVNARNLEASIYDVILHDVPIEDVIEPTTLRNLFVVPATIDLAGAEIELVPVFSRELRLLRAVETVEDDFDFVLIDCPPSLGLLTVNGLAAAGEVVVPIQCEYYALEGLGQLLRNVGLVRSNLNPGLELSTIILTMYDARTRLAEQVVTEVREHFGDRVCRNVVPRSVRLSEAPSFGQPIVVFDPSSRGAIAYRELAKEVSGGAPQRVG